uniref:Uncharacterized protein n=1 Tax=Meloidogyne enterolobii TaxID=390850 RepID=A0A6V7VEB9_MELEN|nr:unnamed protein product [Meloidogyne enterolobii]
MGVGIVVDHTKFIEEFPFAVKELLRENQESNPNTLIENYNKIKEAINQFPNGQIQTFLEAVEKAIEEKTTKNLFLQFLNLKRLNTADTNPFRLP